MSIFATVGYAVKSHGATIATVAGVVGVVGAGVMACKATIKANEIKIELTANVEAIKESGYADEKELNAALRHEYFDAGRRFLKVYGPAMLVGGLSIGSILYGHNILNKKNLLLAGAYKALTVDYDGYRNRVVERLGSDMERSIKYNMQTINTNDLNGNEVNIEYVPEEMSNMVTDRSRFFDEASIYFDDEDPEANKRFLLEVQERAQKKYDRDGYLFLSWVYKQLDFQETYASNVCGWVKGYGDENIDFGIFDIYSSASRRFVNGLEPVILLNFNDDGYIADKI